jgi:hypothetical protein
VRERVRENEHAVLRVGQQLALVDPHEFAGREHGRLAFRCFICFRTARGRLLAGFVRAARLLEFNDPLVRLGGSEDPETQLLVAGAARPIARAGDMQRARAC